MGPSCARSNLRLDTSLSAELSNGASFALNDDYDHLKKSVYGSTLLRVHLCIKRTIKLLFVVFILDTLHSIWNTNYLDI